MKHLGFDHLVYFNNAIFAVQDKGILAKYENYGTLSSHYIFVQKLQILKQTKPISLRYFEKQAIESGK